MLSDFRYVLRGLRKSPIFSLTAILTIAFGIAAATAIFSVVDAVLIRPLPYRDPARLVIVRSDMLKRSVHDFPLSNADFIDLKNGSADSLEDLTAVQTNRAAFPLPDGTSQQLRVAIVSTNFFRVLGGRLAAGRDFNSADGKSPLPPANAPAPQNAAAAPSGPPQIAILSYEYWRNRFGGDTAIFGKPMFEKGPIIVGVLAPGFELTFPPSAGIERKIDIWLAARMVYDNANRNNVAWRAIGRLKRGATVDRAQADAVRVAAELRHKFSIRETSGFALFVQPMHQHLVESARPAVLALMASVIFLLLIACANVANLLLVRASLREREFAVRTALGGGRWHLIRQTGAEVLVLAILGSSAGLALAWVVVKQLLRLAPAGLPRVDTVHIDAGVVAFAAVMGLAAAALFGIVPVLRLARPNLMQILRTDGRAPALSGGSFFRSALVVAEVALCFILLVGSGLMLRSFIALQRVDPGFDSKGLLTVELDGLRGDTPQERAAVQRQLYQSLNSLPGVASAAATFPLPLAGGFSPIRWGTEQALVDPSKFQGADLQIVLPGYFETMRSRIIEGRTFNDQDNIIDSKKVVVDQLLARKAFGDSAAVGKRILVRVRTPEPEWVEIIGVVGHQASTSLAVPGHEQIYFTDSFIGYGGATIWVLRAQGDEMPLVSPVRQAVAKIDSRAVVVTAMPMGKLVDQARAATRFQLLLISVFATIAALLAAVGMYGVLATVVRQRSAEIGVRMALGASSKRVFFLVVGQGLRWSAIGIGLGVAASVGLAQLMSSMLIKVKPTDPLTFAVVSLAFLAIAAFAAWVPARRAATLDPMGAMRGR
jgi:predicted permease